jgi:hypothetical protein
MKHQPEPQLKYLMDDDEKRFIGTLRQGTLKIEQFIDP